MKKKKIIALTLFCISSAAAILAVSYNQGVFVENKKQEVNLPNDFTITAHTGCEYTEDNSLDSIIMGAKNSADIVEFDLNFDTNGRALLSHDEPKGDEVSLNEAFAAVADRDGLKVNVDIKTDKNLSQVYTLAEKHGILDRIFFTGVDSEERAQKIKKECPGVAYYLNVGVDKSKNTDEDYLLSLCEEVKKSGAVGINFNKDSASKELCDTFHAEDLLVSIWTVDSRRDLSKILSFGPDNITTRRPGRAAEILREIKNKEQ